jgi:UDP-glucose 4-epimerase
MPCSTSSGASSPGRFSSGSDCDDIDTPFTERSILFDDHDIEIAVQQSVADQYILVVGGCGFIGSHTVWELAKAGYNVIASLFPRTGLMLIVEFAGAYNRQSQ